MRKDAQGIQATGVPQLSSVQKLQPSGKDNNSVGWRSLFVTNELNELLVEERAIYPGTTLIWFAAFYLGLGW